MNNYAEVWVKRAELATERATFFKLLDRPIEAQRNLTVSEYCLERYYKIKAPMLTRRTDKILNIIGAIVTYAALVTILIYFVKHPK